MGTFVIKKRNIWKGLFFAALPVLCISMLLTACQTEPEESLVLFGEGAYKYKLVYSHQREDWEDTAIVMLYDGLEDLCGVKPELIADSELADAEGSKEILIGSTNRAESNLP